MNPEKRTPTPHNAAQYGEIAPTVLMAGDPLRAKFIAETYLENAELYNEVRGMLGYTGLYQGKRISVQGHGMGMPSIGIYTYELYHFYGVERIIRIGSAGSIQPHIRLGDVVAAMGACTDSAYLHQYELQGNYAPIAAYPLLERAAQAAKGLDVRLHVGNVLSTDVFYSSAEVNRKWADMGVLAIEMEAAALYANAAHAGKEALCLLTISDCIFTGEASTTEERRTGFKTMIELALQAV